MKKFPLFIILLLPCMAAMCQTSNTLTPEYDYAVLQIIMMSEDRLYLADRKNPSYIIHYDSKTAEEVGIYDTIKIDRANENFTQGRFKCIAYLNSRGYELVTGTCFPYNTDVGLKIKYEYVFKRPKQVSVK